MTDPQRLSSELDALRKEVARYQWFHRINLGGNIITPGINDSQGALEKIKLPVSLKGMRVLDIGTCDGFYSFEAERRNAVEVVAIDLRNSGHKEKFELASKLLHSQVKYIELDVYDIDPKK
ncbi:MAG: hypothetical protein NC923_04460 [Candidatus Omnitrophica bacterium]|nr:hypothetical protein [Candidatus Omnitrophota bacterium]